MTLTAAHLKELLHYNRRTGVFTWRRRQGRAAPGHIAGATRSGGGLEITIDGKHHRTARLACLYVTGAWPVGEMRRRNGDLFDDRWKNLLDKPLSASAMTKAVGQPNSLRRRGVTISRPGKFRARVGVNGARIHIGYFATADAAFEARQRAAVRLHGEFARAP